MTWLQPNDLRSILSRKKADNIMSCSLIRHKKTTKKKIEFNTLFPNYPNNYCGEGIVKEDAYAFRYLVNNLDVISDEANLMGN